MSLPYPAALRRWFPLLTAMLLAAGCSSSDSTPATTAGVAQPQAGRSDFLSLLAAVPDTPDNRVYVVVNDYAQADLEGRLSRPPRESSNETVAGYLANLLDETRRGLSVFPDFWGAGVTRVESWRNELGFSILDADRDIFAGVPPRRYRVVLGRFDPALVDEAVRSDPNFADLLEEADHDGVAYFTWGDQATADLARASDVRPVGRGGQLAVLEDRVVWTMGDAEMVAALDTRSGKLPSLADDEGFRLAAAALEDAAVYTAVLTHSIMAADDAVGFAATQRPEAEAEMRAMQAEEGFLLRYDLVGIGAALPGDRTPRAVIVLVNPDEETARENAARLDAIISSGSSPFTGRPWSVVARVDEVTATGRVTVAVLHTPSPSYFRTMVDVIDSLLLYGER